MAKLDDLLGNFESIDFLEVKEGFLLKRRDKKYVVHQSSLPNIIKALEGEYKLMTVNGLMFNQYHTEYFDTPAFDMYTMHHNGRKSRYKLRNRTYVSTDVSFSEFKEKNNKSVTHKTRKLMGKNEDEADFSDLMPKALKDDTIEYEKKLVINYDRLTFVNETNRITIDQNLVFNNTAKQRELKQVAIVEFKYNNASKWRLFNRLMLDEKVRPTSISKYCVGVSYLYGKKSNNFKSVLREINKIEIV